MEPGLALGVKLVYARPGLVPNIKEPELELANNCPLIKL